MKTENHIEIPLPIEKGIPVFYYENAPIYCKDGNIYYAYDGAYCVFCKVISKDGAIQEFSKKFSDGSKSCLARDWKIFEYNGHVILSCGNQKPPTPAFPDKIVCSIFLDLDNDMKEITLPEEIEKQHLCRVPTDETAEIKLSDCSMRYKNSRSYQCFDTDGNLLWTEKHKGYRYTDFEEKDDCIIFGTAGHGGGLYCYRKSDGQCLCAVDTKGTSIYVWFNNLIVCSGRNGELLFVDPFKGEIVETIRMKAIFFSDMGSFFSNDKYLCAVGFEKKTKAPHIMIFF